MKIVGTIVDKNIKLVGLLVKGSPSDFGYNDSHRNYSINPLSIEEIKMLINKGKITDYKINEKGNIEGINKKLSDLPMYDNEGEIVDKRIAIKAMIKNNDKLIGGVVVFLATGKEKKLKIDDLLKIYEYCEPTNFILRKKNSGYYVAGKGETKKVDITEIDYDAKDNKEKSEEKVYDFIITEVNQNYFLENCLDNNGILSIPETFKMDGKKYKVIGIDKHAFSFISDFNTVKIPNSVSFIKGGSFSACDGLEIVFLPFNVCNIEGVFQSSPNIIAYIVDEKNVNYVSSDGVLFDGLKKTLIKYPCGSDMKKYEIPYGVNKIINNAFSDYQSLEELIIPQTVREICEDAFYQMDGVELKIKYQGTKEEWEKYVKFDNNYGYVKVEFMK